MTATSAGVRLDGLDVARFVALVGMVVVNFKVVMGVVDDGSLLSLLTGALEGKAAATFVVLAGVGLGLAALRRNSGQLASVTLKRAVFLLAVGLLNSVVFDADILHYYAIYFLFGVCLLPLRTQWLVAAIIAEAASAVVSGPLAAIDPALEALATTAPMPPAPLFIVAGSGAAALVIGLCLRLSRWLDQSGILRIVTPAGRQTLTLYIAHILVGMGTLDALGMLGNQTMPAAITAALAFCLLCVVYALLWSRFFKRGPIEAAMRKVAG